MGSSEFWTAVARIRERDERYRPEGYAFVMEALETAVRRAGERRHVSAAELLQGAWFHARRVYGLMALTVLQSWGIRSGGDVGEIVFHLIDAGVLSRREEDSRADFDQPVDLQAVLERDYFETER